MKNNQKLLASVALIAVVVIAGYFALSKKVSTPVSMPESETKIDTSDWKTYTINQKTDPVNGNISFSMQYPLGWKYSETKGYGHTYGVAFIGEEGQIRVTWGDGFGGAYCQDVDKEGKKFQPYSISEQGLSGCLETDPNGLKAWWLFKSSNRGQISSVIIVARENMVNRENLIKQILSTFKFTNSDAMDALSWKETVYNEFKNLAAWEQKSLPDWQFADYTYANERRIQLKKHGTGKILMISKSFNKDGCQSDCSAEGIVQDNLVANIKTSLSQNGWVSISWPTEPSFYTDYLYVKDGHPLILQIGTRNAITGGMYVSIQFLY